MLLCASLPLVLVVVSLCTIVIMTVLMGAVSAALSAVLCFDYCPGEPQPVLPSLSSGALTMWFALFALESALLVLIACAVGYFHAQATDRRRMAFVLGPLLLLEIGGLVSGVLGFSVAGFSPLFPLAFFTSFLVSVVCLVYAARLK